jgi:chromosome segregation ATPase
VIHELPGTCPLCGLEQELERTEQERSDAVARADDLEVAVGERDREIAQLKEEIQNMGEP